MRQEALVHEFKVVCVCVCVCMWCTVCVCVCVYVSGEEGDEGSCGQRGRKL